MAEGRPGTGGVDPLDRLVAHDEIRLLVARYAVALDARDLDTLIGLFVPDVQVGGDRSGPAALRESFESQLGPLGVTILFVGNHVIDLDDADHAHGTVYCRAEIEDPEECWICQAIVYRDTYERRDGRWLFARRRHDLFYGQRVADPLAQQPADWPRRQVGRGTMPEAWETWPD